MCVCFNFFLIFFSIFFLMSMFRYNKCRFRVDITTALSLVREERAPPDDKKVDKSGPNAPGDFREIRMFF